MPCSTGGQLRCHHKRVHPSWRVRHLPSDVRTNALLTDFPAPSFSMDKPGHSPTSTSAPLPRKGSTLAVRSKRYPHRGIRKENVPLTHDSLHFNRIAAVTPSVIT